LMSHASSIFSVSRPTPGTVTFPVKFGISCTGVDWNLTLTCDSVTMAFSGLLGIGKTFLFHCVCDACNLCNSIPYIACALIKTKRVCLQRLELCCHRVFNEKVLDDMQHFRVVAAHETERGRQHRKDIAWALIKTKRECPQRLDVHCHRVLVGKVLDDCSISASPRMRLSGAGSAASQKVTCRGLVCHSQHMSVGVDKKAIHIDKSPGWRTWRCH